MQRVFIDGKFVLHFKIAILKNILWRIPIFESIKKKRKNPHWKTPRQWQYRLV